MPPPASLSVVVEPAQTVVVPTMLDGKGFTVKGATVAQPVVRVYVMLVLPALTPVTNPVPVTVATVGVLLTQLPPGAASS